MLSRVSRNHSGEEIDSPSRWPLADASRQMRILNTSVTNSRHRVQKAAALRPVHIHSTLTRGVSCRTVGRSRLVPSPPHGSRTDSDVHLARARSVAGVLMMMCTPIPGRSMSARSGRKSSSTRRKVTMLSSLHHPHGALVNTTSRCC